MRFAAVAELLTVTAYTHSRAHAYITHTQRSCRIGVWLHAGTRWPLFNRPVRQGRCAASVGDVRSPRRRRGGGQACTSAGRHAGGAGGTDGCWSLRRKTDEFSCNFFYKVLSWTEGRNRTRSDGRTRTGTLKNEQSPNISFV